MPKLSCMIFHYLIAVSSMFGLLFVIDFLIRGETSAGGWPLSLTWAALVSALFIAARQRNMRLNIT